jgi:Uma2 family endonuclease
MSTTRTRPITAEEYVRMAEQGILGPDERIELIEGDIVEMSPQSAAHTQAVVVLTRVLVNAYPEPFRVVPQSTIRAGGRSMPEPDLAVATAGGADRLARVDETVLLIEVALDSLHEDLGRKASLYAREGAPCYWVVDLVARRVVVHTDPRPDGSYRRVEIVDGGTLALPGVDSPLEVSRILG